MKKNSNYNFQLLIFFALLCKILFAYFHSFIFSVPGLASDTYGFTLAAIELFLSKNYFYEGMINLNEYYQDKYHLLWLNSFLFGNSDDLFNLYLSNPYVSFLYNILFFSGLSSTSITENIDLIFFIFSFSSIFLWFVSILILIEILKILRIEENYFFFILFTFCFLPSIFLFTNVPLREGLEILSVLIFVLIILNLYNKKYLYIILLPFNFYIAYVTHHALFYSLFISFIFIFTLIFYLYISSLYFNKIKNLITLILFFLLLILIFFLFDYLKMYLTNFLIGASSIINRTRYNPSVLNMNYNFFEFISYYILNFLKYNFEPLFYRNLLSKDLLIIFENIIRFFLMMGVFITSFKAFNKKNFNSIFFLIILSIFFIIESIWSLGTISWGTAFRHHSTANILIFILFFYNLNVLRYKNIN